MLALNLQYEDIRIHAKGLSLSHCAELRADAAGISGQYVTLCNRNASTRGHDKDRKGALTPSLPSSCEYLRCECHFHVCGQIIECFSVWGFSVRIYEKRRSD